ncbi:TauD/TfdA family dioxygenase [Adonisia turfae]|uniref:TauD/TfdA-like domain-containing protein n=1 Tax=Adonisia turfae CCMR0081 TaxID=2292702 RepID=A0A6M0RSM1_9CYAN|nr:TauD/TfdA family dioxygenase [Adonisia turfae]NEZ58711.1 hypothetical protein [Adonisia turfae CCMR0081]
MSIYNTPPYSINLLDTNSWELNSLDIWKDSHRIAFQRQAEKFKPFPEHDLNTQLQCEALKLLKYFKDFQLPLKKVHHQPYMVITELPIDPKLPAPPTNGQRPKEKNTWISELLLLCLSKIANLHPPAYKEEKQGDLIHQIAPRDGYENTVSNAGRVTFALHTDAAILKPPYTPEFLLVLGLLNEHDTPTYLASLDEILAQLTPNDIQILSEPRFHVESPGVMKIWGGKIIRSERRPLITIDQDQCATINAHLHTTKATDPVAELALSALKDAANKVARSVSISPGTLVILNNFQCMHGRSEVTGQRWLQRLYV